MQPSEKSAKNYHHGDLKRALLQKGLDVIETEGLSGLSLRKLAAQLGVSHTAPKNHFPSAKHFLTALGTEGFRMFAQAMRSGVGEGETRRARLHAAIQGYVQFATQHPELFRLMFSPEFTDFKDDAARAAAAQSREILSDVSRDLQWDGSAGAHSQERTEIMLWAFVHGYAALLTTEQIADPQGAPLFPILDVMPALTYPGETK